MSDAPPKEGNGVVKIRETYQLIVIRGPFPSLPKKDCQAKYGYFSGIFGCFGVLRGGPGVTDG